MTPTVRIPPRKDLRADATLPPKQLREALGRFGGWNPYNEPLYRLVLAEDRLQTASGNWCVWRPNMSQDEKSGLGVGDIQNMLREYKEWVAVAAVTMPRHEWEKVEKELAGTIDEFVTAKLRTPAHPDKVVTGMIQLPAYNCKGWILEKWRTAESFGSIADWYQFQFEGQAALGPYPHNGEYSLFAGPTPIQPSLKECQEAVRREMRQIEAKPASPRERVIKMMADMERFLESEHRDVMNTIESQMKEDTVLLTQSTSIEAERVRQDMLGRAAARNHRAAPKNVHFVHMVKSDA